MDDFVKPILVIFLIMCVFTGIALFCGYHISKDACYSKYADFGATACFAFGDILSNGIGKRTERLITGIFR